MCSTRCLRIRISESIAGQAGTGSDAQGAPGSTVWSRRAHLMSAISASQDSRPQFVSVQHLTSRLESVQATDPVATPERAPDGPSLKSARPAARIPAAAPADPPGPDRAHWHPAGDPCCAPALAGRVPHLPGQGGRFRRRPSVTPTVTVTVQAGQSLWAIAGAAAPERDPRDVIADIVQLNNLSAGGVVPGPATVRPHAVGVPGWSRRQAGRTAVPWSRPAQAAAGRHIFRASASELNCSGE